jgi:hypothetical protein
MEEHKQDNRDAGAAVTAPPTHEVVVIVDSHKKKVVAGSWIVAEFKKAVGVDESRALDQVVGGEFKPLEDNARISIKGGETFVSHVRQGSSS